jgi:ketosteroid isomerase-like protein
MTDAENIALLQRAWMDAWINRDLATCERLLAPEFRLRSVATDSVVDREEWLAQAGSGRIAGTAFTYETMDVAVVGDTAVTMSRTRQQAKIDDRDWSATLHVSDVWARRDGAWAVVAVHASPLVGRTGAQTASRTG